MQPLFSRRAWMRTSAVWLLLCSACFANADGGGGSAFSGAPPSAPSPGTTNPSASTLPGSPPNATGTCSGLAGPCSTSLETIPLTGCVVGDYTASVTVGTGMAFNLIMDSGSTSVAVASSNCSNCTAVSPEYKVDATAMATNKTAQGTYGDGSGWKGTVFTDNIAVAPALGTVNMAFAAITSQNMARNARNFFSPTYCTGVAEANTSQGIFGLGGARIELPNTDAFLDKLKATNKVADAFSFHACDMNGHMWLGGYPPSYVTASPVFTPMDDSTGFYVVRMRDLTVNGKSAGLSTASFGTAIADTGTSIFLMPNTAFNALVKLVEADNNYLSLFGSGFLANGQNCTPPAKPMTKAQLDAMLPPMSMVFDGVAGGAPVEVELPATESYLTPSVDPAGNPCYFPAVAPSGAATTTGPSTIIGNSAMHSHVVIFDRANKQLGFAPQTGCQ